jgi:hypothetical protein
MAIRDGLAIDLDEAKTEAVVSKGKVRYVAPPAQPAPRRVMKIAAVLLVAVLVLAAVYYIYSQRDVADTLKISVDKSALAPGEEITVTVSLQNNGPKTHSYTLSSSEAFGWEITNSTGGIVAEGPSNVTQQTRQVTTGPGRTVRLGDFSWNQTIHGYDGDNETWTPVPSGEYVVRAYFRGSADISAEKRITIG